MHVTFHGAVREVTGSMHVAMTKHDRILFDCGMFQGRRKEADLKNRALHFDPKILTNMILSHAHIDHSGRIPLLTKNDFHGRIVCTRATADACSYLLSDSAKIQQSDAEYLNYKRLRSVLVEMQNKSAKTRGQQEKLNKVKKLLKKDRQELNREKIDELIARYHIEGVEPLYTVEDAETGTVLFRRHSLQKPGAGGKKPDLYTLRGGPHSRLRHIHPQIREQRKKTGRRIHRRPGTFRPSDPEKSGHEFRGTGSRAGSSDHGKHLRRPSSRTGRRSETSLGPGAQRGGGKPRDRPDSVVRVRAHPGAFIRHPRNIRREPGAEISGLRGQSPGDQHHQGVRRTPGAVRQGHPRNLFGERQESVPVRPCPLRLLGGAVHGAEPGRIPAHRHIGPRACARRAGFCTI